MLATAKPSQMRGSSDESDCWSGVSAARTSTKRKTPAPNRNNGWRAPTMISGSAGYPVNTNADEHTGAERVEQQPTSRDTKEVQSRQDLKERRIDWVVSA